MARHPEHKACFPTPQGCAPSHQGETIEAGREAIGSAYGRDAGEPDGQAPELRGRLRARLSVGGWHLRRRASAILASGLRPDDSVVEFQADLRVPHPFFALPKHLLPVPIGWQARAVFQPERSSAALARWPTSSAGSVLEDGGSARSGSQMSMTTSSSRRGAGPAGPWRRKPAASDASFAMRERADGVRPRCRCPRAAAYI